MLVDTFGLHKLSGRKAFLLVTRIATLQPTKHRGLEAANGKAFQDRVAMLSARLARMSKPPPIHFKMPGVWEALETHGTRCTLKMLGILWKLLTRQALLDAVDTLDRVGTPDIATPKALQTM